jgi:hypothetical protein
MNESNTTNPVDDILTNDLTSTDTRNPLLAKARYAFKVAKVEAKDGKEENGVKKRSVSIQLKINQTVTGADSQPITAGTTFFDNIAITPTDKWSADDIKKSLKKFQNAMGVTGPFYPLEQYEGRELEAEVSIQPAKGEYNERNRFMYVNKTTGKAE